MMKTYVSTLDQYSLQTALDTACGAGIFTTGRDKLDNGTRPIYYACADDTIPAVITTAAEIAAQQDQYYLDNTKSKLLEATSRVAAKSRLRQPSCSYSQSDQIAAQTWLADPIIACPLVVQVRAVSKSITTTLAAQQIDAIYNSYLAYPSNVDSIIAQGQTNILNAPDLFAVKNAYQATTTQLEQLENTDYGAG